MSVDET